MKIFLKIKQWYYEQQMLYWIHKDDFCSEFFLGSLHKRRQKIIDAKLLYYNERLKKVDKLLEE